MTAVVEADSLSKRAEPGGPWLLDAFDLRLDAGAVTAVLGTGAAAPRALARIVLGLCRPDGGAVRVFGADPRSLQARRRLGYVPAVPAYPARLRPAEIMDYSGRLAGLPGSQRSDRARQALEWAGLAGEGRPASRLSAGRLKRLGVAQALLARPELLVLEEPGLALDSSEQRDVRRLVAALGRDGCAVLLCAGARDAVLEACAEVVLVESGRALARGGLQQVMPAGQDLEGALRDISASRRLADQAGMPPP